MATRRQGEFHNLDVDATFTVDGSTITAAELAYVDISALGTGAASKAVVLDAGEDYTWPATGKLTYGGTAIDSTGLEINQVCDASARIVASTDEATLTMSAALHSNKILYLDDTDGMVITMPAAAGTGVRYMVLCKTANASGDYVINVSTNGADLIGGAMGVDDDTDAPLAWKAETNDNTITMDGTAQGGKAGDWIRLTDVATNVYLVEGFLTQSGGSEATPFSAV